MFCPKCKAEYRDGFTECADCNIALVYELPAEIEREKNNGCVDLKELLTTNDQGEIALFKSILEGEKIPFVPQGDHFSTMQAYGMTVRFLVPKDYLEQARQLLEEFI
jgi:hypothetical protein